MEKNAILAIVLSVLVLFLWQWMFIAPQQQQLAEEQQQQEELGQQPGAGATPVPSQQTPVGLTPAAEVVPATSDVKRQADAEAQEVRVETPLFHAVFTTQGARLTSWRIKAHKDSTGEPVELVSDDARQQFQYPLEVFTGDASLDTELNFGHYRASSTELVLASGDEPAALSFSYETPAGLIFTKTLQFSPESYKVNVTLKFGDPSRVGRALAVVWGPGLGAGLNGATRFEPGAVTQTRDESKLVRDPAKKIDGIMTHKYVEWAALDQKYFTVALFAENLNNTLTLNTIDLPLQEGEKSIEPIRKLMLGLSQPLESGECRISLYAGPKERPRLARVYPGFEDLIDYGFFSFIAEPLAAFMTFLYGYVNNYGVVIICLTILIKIIFYPLTHKSFTSMKKMQDLQPKMNALREKYKKDTQKLNQEMMKLYKEEGVNPMGGCLPMLLQIPVFFALYQTLSQSIELRGATFLWISDLSAPEPAFLKIIKPLVLMMGASMLWQQSMTPTTADNKQAQMFKFLPILFTAMFWNFPAGLVLYWFTNNILTVGQQQLIHRKKKND